MKYLITLLIALSGFAAIANQCEYADDLDSRGHRCGARATRGNL
jgi:hypothetical protein